MRHLSYLLVIGVLVAIIFLQQECGRPADCPEVSVKSDTQSTPSKDKVVTVYKFLPGKIKIRVDTVEVPADIDTNKVVPDYFTVKHYEDSGRKVDNYFYRWKARISQNKIDSFQLDFQNLKPDKVITHTVTVKDDPRNKLFVGGQINYSQNVTGGASLLLLTKREHLYGYSYDPFLKGHSVMLGWKIRLKKRINN